MEAGGGAGTLTRSLGQTLVRGCTCLGRLVVCKEEGPTSEGHFRICAHTTHTQRTTTPTQAHPWTDGDSLMLLITGPGV